MSKTLSYEIADDIYALLQDVAVKWGRPLEDVCLEWLARTIPKPRPKMTPEEEQAADQRFRRHFGAIDSRDPHSADNERIDADLAREYGSSHEHGET